MSENLARARVKKVNSRVLFYILLALFFLTFALTLVVATGLLDHLLSATIKLVLVIVIALIAIGLLVFALFAFANSKKFSVQKRLDSDVFPLLDNVFDERALVEKTQKILKRNKGKKVAAVTFSTFKFKKEVFLRYGYEKESQVISVIFYAIDKVREAHPKVIYGFDFTENFLVLVEGLDEGKLEGLLDKLTERINKVLEEYQIDIDFFPHYGVCFNDMKDDVITAETIYQSALTASDYGRLSSERGGMFVFDETMFSRNERNVSLARDIEKGIENNEFEVYLQPKYDLNLKRFSGAEALIRWHHPERGTILPGAFITLAEQSDLVIRLDYYMLDRVCKYLAEWRDRGVRLLPVSVNISKRTLFTVDIAKFIEKTIKTYEINPLLLEIEIVESPSPYDVLFLLTTVKKIKALNIKVAIDDFGTGFSSLSYIKKIPFDIIKIDKAFLSDIEIDEKSRGIVKEIIKLAHILETYVVIEGVQENEQIKLLKTMGADCIQGYYYSEPLKPVEYITFITRNKFEKGR